MVMKELLCSLRMDERIWSLPKVLLSPFQEWWEGFAQGAAVPMPVLGTGLVVLAHGAFVQPDGIPARAEAFSSDRLGPSLIG